MSLHALELNSVIEAPWLAAATLHPRTLVLKFAIVKELEKLLIFFVFNDHSMSEKNEKCQHSGSTSMS